jgi:hypothetical protein
VSIFPRAKTEVPGINDSSKLRNYLLNLSFKYLTYPWSEGAYPEENLF